MYKWVPVTVLCLFFKSANRYSHCSSVISYPSPTGLAVYPFIPPASNSWNVPMWLDIDLSICLLISCIIFCSSVTPNSLISILLGQFDLNKTSQ